MIAETAPMDWPEANRRYLAAEFRRIGELLRAAAGPRHSTSDLHATVAAVEDARAAMPAEPAIETLARAFALTAFERDVLLLAAAVEMDPAIAAWCGAGATFGMALVTFPEAQWSAITPRAALRHWRLLDAPGEAGVSSGALRIDERILHFIAGVDELDARLQPLLSPRAEPAVIASDHQVIARGIAGNLRSRDGGWPVVQLFGDDDEGQLDVAAWAAGHAGWVLYVLRAEDVPALRSERWALATLWARETVLRDGALLIDGTAGDGARAAELLEDLGGVAFVAARDPIELKRETIRVRVAKPSAAERRRIWAMALGPMPATAKPHLDIVASQAAMSAGAIARAAASIRDGAVGGDPFERRLNAACRGDRAGRLEGLAHPVEAATSWDDLVLPPTLMETLREIVGQVRHRITVYDEWGFRAKSPRGLAITALFAGESGTGKTMAAEAIATDLGLDLYRVDLSAVVSKYIGETEKNLRRVFDAGEGGGVLLFDEAEALFGKRSEVRDSHDRYANIELSYLLQRMEAYGGLAILTTNARSALDRAFQRRLRFIVQFPFPDAAQRERIWRGVFPAGVRTKRLDHTKLARLAIAGGTIRNVAVNAAFLAAQTGRPVTMALLARAARQELEKSDKPVVGTDTKDWT